MPQDEPSKKDAGKALQLFCFSLTSVNERMKRCGGEHKYGHGSASQVQEVKGTYVGQEARSKSCPALGEVLLTSLHTLRIHSETPSQ